MNKKRSTKIFTIPRIIISIVAFILIAGILVLVAVNIHDLSFDAMGKTLKAWFGGKADGINFDYEDKEPSSFSGLDDGIIAASNTGFVIYDKWGDKIAHRDVVMESPVAISNGTVSGVYDCGGYTLFMVDDGGDAKSFETEGKIVSVSVNEEDWFAVCTEEDNYKGSVTVLNDKYEAVYKLYSGDGYILSAELSDDCEMLLAMKLSSVGTEIVEYRLDSEEEQARISIPSQVAVKCKYGGYGDISVLTDSAFYVYSTDGALKNSYDFSGSTLENFDLDDDGYSVIYCGAYQDDIGAYIAVLDDSGNVIAKQNISKTVVDISAVRQNVAVLYTDGLTIYDKNLKEQKNCEITSGASAVVMCEDGTAIVTSEYSAEVLG